MKKLNMKMYNNKTSNVQTSNISHLTSNAGITLIALIITIIVLLILAGITLNMVMGDSGIFRKANKASDDTNYKQARETVELALLSARMEYTLNKNLKGAEFINFIQKESKEITVEQTGTGEALDTWDMSCNGWVFNISDLKIVGESKGKINASIKNMVVTEEYQFATTAGNKAQVEFEVELQGDLEGATVEVTPKTTGKGTVEGKVEGTKYTGTITTNGTDNPNGEYTYEINITKDGTVKTMTAISRVEKFLSDPTIEIAEESIKYDRFTVKVTSNYQQDAGIKYKYYVTNTSADFETATTKQITELDPETEYNVKVEAYLADEETYKPAETTVTTPEKLVEIDSIEDLEKISEDLAGSYKLTKSLDFKDRNSYETQEKYEYYTVDADGDGKPDNSWEGIGKNYAESFAGIFDGQFYTINNVYINSTTKYSGFFMAIEGGIVKNLKLENIDVTSTADNTGGITGLLGGSNAKIEKVGVSGIIQAGKANTGGIAGILTAGATIEQSYSKCEIISTGKNVGGIFGSGDTTGAYIIDCYSSGSVSGGEYTGGLFGLSGYVTNCYSTSSTPKGSYQGALYGYWCSIETSAFWSQETSGATKSGTSNYGTECTIQELKTKSTYTDAGWDFDTVWEMDHSTGYPRLQWE